MLSRLTALLLCLAAARSLSAQVPQLINYQGRVVVGTANFSGPGAFKFALVNPDGTATYWSNDGTSTAGSEPTAAVSLTVANGLYSVLLGDATLPNMTVVSATVFTNPDVRLRVWFNDGTHGSQQLAPDQRIAAVGYALMAGNVPDGSITAAKLAPGAVTATSIAAGSITGTQLAAGTVTAANLAVGVATTAGNNTFTGAEQANTISFSGYPFAGPTYTPYPTVGGEIPIIGTGTTSSASITNPVRYGSVAQLQSRTCPFYVGGAQYFQDRGDCVTAYPGAGVGFEAAGGGSYCVEFATNAPAFLFRSNTDTGAGCYTLWVNGKISPVTFPAGNVWMPVTFPAGPIDGTIWRNIRIEIMGQARFGGIVIGDKYALRKPNDNPATAVAVGSSYTETYQSAEWPIVLSKILNLNVIGQGSGGTGGLRGINSGDGAHATATISAGIITGAGVTAGGIGYGASTTVSVGIIGGGGSGATAFATTDGSGHVASVTITAGGTGYSGTPYFLFWTPTGRYPAFSSQRIYAIIDAKPSVVFWEIGINDGPEISADGGSTASFSTAYAIAVNAVRAGLPNARMVFLTPCLPRMGSLPLTGNNLALTNAVIAQQAATPNSILVDTSDLFTGTGYNGSGTGTSALYIRSDGVHPTAAGHRALAERVAQQYLAAFGVTQATTALGTPQNSSGLYSFGADPAGVVTAPIGTLLTRSDNGQLYINTSGTTSWTLVGPDTGLNTASFSGGIRVGGTNSTTISMMAMSATGTLFNGTVNLSAPGALPTSNALPFFKTPAGTVGVLTAISTTGSVTVTSSGGAGDTSSVTVLILNP